jgi:hypothetical protein
MDLSGRGHTLCGTRRAVHPRLLQYRPDEHARKQHMFGLANTCSVTDPVVGSIAIPETAACLTRVAFHPPTAAGRSMAERFSGFRFQHRLRRKQIRAACQIHIDGVY